MFSRFQYLRSSKAKKYHFIGLFFCFYGMILYKLEVIIKMKNIEIIKVKLRGIIDCINKYTHEATIQVVLEALSKAMEENDYEMILFLCQEIDKWYSKNINKIESNEYVYNKEVHRDNLILIKDIIADLELNEKEYRGIFVPLSKKVESSILSEEKLENLFNRFHQIVLQLRDRYNDRDTLDVSDEYYVQDLLHALLNIYCEDIRCEEWTPSYAGSSSRQDFLLKNEQIVIETKKTRKGLNNKVLADEIIIDITRYQMHPDCKKLICFVYDPENRIKNPRGFEKDLNKVTSEFAVKVFIRPCV